MRGFTLIEIAMVLLIMALLLGSLLAPLTAQIDQQKITETRKSLAGIQEALIGHAIANGRLPCPAISATDGNEKSTCTTPANRQGFVPWVKLGVGKLDAWGHIYRYSVTPAYASTFTLTSNRDITIQTRNAGGALVNLSNSTDIPAVVLSHGKNGYGSTNDSGAVMAAVPVANVDELTNATNGTASPYLFVSRTPTPSGVTGGEYDDIVVWISPNTLFNRMVAAGKLP